jgi:DNA-binding transcriptional LysR family regulator
MPALLAAASAGIGIAALSEPWGLRSPGLLLLFPLASVEARPIWLATAPEAGGRAAVRIVADRIAEVMGRAGGPRR